MVTIKNVNTGIGSLSSAISGASMANNLANKLHIPKEVERKSLGNTVMFRMVDTLQAAATPSLQPNRKIKTSYVLPEKYKTHKPDTPAIPKEAMMEILLPTY